MTAQSDDWWILTLQVPAASAEERAEELRDRFGFQPVSIEQPSRPSAWLEVYFTTEVEARTVAEQVAVLEGLEAVAVRLCRARDWKRFWRHHFHTTRIGRRLLMVPEWEADALACEDGDIPIIIDPGMSFGTGGHFTTRFCLEALESLPDLQGASLLDVGTGSGIIALAGLRLGCSPVLAVDNDPDCLSQTLANARLNALEGELETGIADILQGWEGGRYDIVCANILSLVLIEAAPTLVRIARRYLALSGIREQEADSVAAAFLDLGAREIMRDGDGEWAGILLAMGKSQS